MPENDLVVSDTSPVLNLALIEELELLKDQFEKVEIPSQVWEEILEGEKGREELEKLKSEGFLVEVDVEETDLFVELFKDLDRGESAAIAYAVKNNAEKVLLDEKEGRKAARRHGVNTTGVLGILIKGHKEKKVDLEKCLGELKDVGFWIGEDLENRLINKYCE